MQIFLANLNNLMAQKRTTSITAGDFGDFDIYNVSL